MDEQNSDKNIEKKSENSPENVQQKAQEHIQNIIVRPIYQEMKGSYIDYAMSVIVGRALPDVRDGLKPVHRRILYAMNDLGIVHNKPFKKSARIVGECLGMYHPHGDTAVYDSLVRMAQDFSLRYRLIDGQGNFGSVDGDNAASIRYTEARTKKIAEEMLEDLEKETVLFVDNFDGSLKEPSVLPSKVPNLLINGSSGIAVGMATNIPPHNITETCTAIIRILENPEISIQELLLIMNGPDFPTGGIICGRNGIAEYFSTGRGKVLVRGKTHIEKKHEKESIIITEIPYMTNKALMIESLAEHIKNKVIEGISDIRDESDRDGMRAVIELKRDAISDVVLNNLYKHTNLQTTFGIILLALVNNEPKILPMKEVITEFIKHRKHVVVKRTEFDLRKAEERAHILEGLIIALNNIDKAVALIKASKSVELARQGLMNSFTLSEIQANAILEMKLQRLTSLEQDKIREEHKGLLTLIADLKDILAKNVRVIDIIIAELRKLIEEYGDTRKTEISETDEQLEIEDLIPQESVAITITHAGYIKRLPVATYKSQRRGGKGIVATTTKDEDFVEDLFVANTHDYILFFTNTGKVHWLKVYRVPEASRIAKGKAIVNLLELPENEKITAFIPISKFDDKHYLLMVTKKGIVKKTNLDAYSNVRAGGIIAITVEDGDELVTVLLTDGSKQIILATAEGNAVKFEEEDARPIGRSGKGVIGIRLQSNDCVIGAVIADENKTLLTITENGYGKRTDISEYRLINRGGSGVINIQCSERNGSVVSICSVTDNDDIIFISKNGIIIRVPSTDISVIGRNTQGVRIMKLEANDKVVATVKVPRENGNGNNGAEEQN